MRGMHKRANVYTHSTQVTYMDARARTTRLWGSQVILVPLMEISRNIRRGFLRGRNERGHRDLNIAVDLLPVPSPRSPKTPPPPPPPPSFKRTQVRRNCLVVESESPCCKRSPLIPPPCKHGFTNRAKAEYLAGTTRASVSLGDSRTPCYELAGYRR